MAGFAPRFCPKHLKIHVCDDISVTKQLKDAENDLGAKVRRLHGQQTEEELAAEAAKAKPAAGTIGDILAKAKMKIASDKEQYLKNSEDTGKETTEAEVSDRMAALRAKMMGGGSSAPSNPSSSNPTPSSPSTGGGLGAVLQKAREHQSEVLEEVYKVPERSTMGEKIKKPDLKKVSTPVNDFFEEMELDNLTAEDVVVNEKEIKKTSKALDKQVEEAKASKKNEREKLYSAEETHELIQSAVQAALKQIGIIDEETGITKIPVKKNATTKKTTSSNKKTTTNKTSVAKKTTTTKKTTSSVDTKPKKTTSTKKDNEVDKTKVPNLK